MEVNEPSQSIDSCNKSEYIVLVFDLSSRFGHLLLGGNPT